MREVERAHIRGTRWVRISDYKGRTDCWLDATQPGVAACDHEGGSESAWEHGLHGGGETACHGLQVVQARPGSGVLPGLLLTLAPL